MTTVQTRHAESIKAFLGRLNAAGGSLTAKEVGDVPSNVKTICIRRSFITSTGRGMAVYALTSGGSAFLAA